MLPCSHMRNKQLRLTYFLALHMPNYVKAILSLRTDQFSILTSKSIEYILKIIHTVCNIHSIMLVHCIHCKSYCICIYCINYTVIHHESSLENIFSTGFRILFHLRNKRFKSEFADKIVLFTLLLHENLKVAPCITAVNLPPDYPILLISGKSDPN